MYCNKLLFILRVYFTLFQSLFKSQYSRAYPNSTKNVRNRNASFQIDSWIQDRKTELVIVSQNTTRQ